MQMHEWKELEIGTKFKHRGRHHAAIYTLELIGKNGIIGKTEAETLVHFANSEAIREYRLLPKMERYKCYETANGQLSWIHEKEFPLACDDRRKEWERKCQYDMEREIEDES